MNEAIVNYIPKPCTARTDHENYRLAIGNSEIILQRGKDFGKFGKSSKPVLLKNGAEKILTAYGISTRFHLDKAVEEFGDENHQPLFFYRVSAEFYYRDTLITTTFGSANSNETAWAYEQMGRGQRPSKDGSEEKFGRWSDSYCRHWGHLQR